LLELTGSEYGFIGEVKVENDKKYLQTHAITNIAWSEATQSFYAQNMHTGLKFYNLDSLFGHVIVHAETVISNNPSLDKRATKTGVPKGHPALNHFLGIPFFEKSGSKMNGMVGIANKPGGYSQEDVDFLEPFITTCANLIQAYAALRENKMLIDTLEEKVAERTSELEVANHRLEEANRLVTAASAAQLEHFACMSHEIRTPLHCIIGVSSLIQETELTQEQEDSVRMIVSSGEVLLTVVNDVLDYSKLVSGNVDIYICQTRLQETLDAVVHSMEMKALDREVTIQTSFDPRIPSMVETDSRRLQQILYNLLGNALKFSRDNGVIELGVHLVDVPREGHETSGKAAAATTANTRRVLRFVVKDHGKGIDKRDFDKIFQPFKQARDTAEQFYGGTGLGLPITAKLVAGLNGTISVDSKVGEWSKFTVDFPFIGPEADISDISARLNNARIFHVCKEEAHDTPFCPESETNIVNSYQLNVAHLQSCQELADLASANGAIDRSRFHVCLIHEDAYDAQAYQSFAMAAGPNVVLLTCGPTYSVKDAHGHYRSLNKILPSVLVESIASHVEKVAAAPTSMSMARRMSETSASFTTHPRIVKGQEKDEATRSLKAVAAATVAPILPLGSASLPKSPSTVGAERARAIVAISSALQLAKSSSLESVFAIQQQQQQQQQQPLKKKTFQDLKILIVEDNMINQKVMVRMLERLGLGQDNVDVADNGQTAVDLTAAQWYDIILMDQQMPIMDGLTASSIILKRQQRVAPTIAIVSANAGEYWEQLVIQTGVKHFIPKPCKLDHIRSFLQTYCQGAGIAMTATTTTTATTAITAATAVAAATSTAATSTAAPVNAGGDDEWEQQPTSTAVQS
jgi:signal transduction histidine kinase/DNA-binding NarL/FixJ family response regulator